MARIRLPISADGPIIDLGVWVGRTVAHGLIAQGQTVRPPLTVRALIDTGASRTAIHPHVLSTIGSIATGRSRLRRADGTNRFRGIELHEVRVAFNGVPAPPARPDWIEIAAAALAPADPNTSALVGRDMLAHCRLLYDGFHGELRLAF